MTVKDKTVVVYYLFKGRYEAGIALRGVYNGSSLG